MVQTSDEIAATNMQIAEGSVRYIKAKFPDLNTTDILLALLLLKTADPMSSQAQSLVNEIFGASS